MDDFIVVRHLFIPLIAQESFQLNLDSPPVALTLLADGIISTSINERDFAISPDGNEIYYHLNTKSTFQTIVVL